MYVEFESNGSLYFYLSLDYYHFLFVVELLQFNLNPFRFESL